MSSPANPNQMFDHFIFTAFESPWFWILLFVQWGMILFRPMSVPYDVIVSPKKTDALFALAPVHAARHTSNLPVWAFLVVGFVCSVLGILAVGYRVELAVAALILVLPHLVIIAMTRRTAARITFDTIDDIRAPLLRLQTWSQALGFGVICTASFIGSAWLFTLGG